MLIKVSPGSSPAMARLMATSDPSSRVTPSRSWPSWLATTIPIGIVISADSTQTRRWRSVSRAIERSRKAGADAVQGP